MEEEAVLINADQDQSLCGVAAKVDWMAVLGCGVINDLSFVLHFMHSAIRCPDFVKRKEFVKMVDQVRDSGGDVKIFSTMHVSGERKLIGRIIKGHF